MFRLLFALILLIVSAGYSQEKEPIRMAPEDFGVHLFFSAAGHGKHCLLSFTEVGKPIPVHRLLLFDMEQGSGVLIPQDGRMNGSRVYPVREGFLLTALSAFGLRKVHLLDKNGGYLRDIALESFENWPDNISITELQSLDDERLCLSYERPTFEEPNVTEVFLGIIDLKQRRFEEIFVHKKRKPAHRVFWVPLGEAFLFINVTSGAVSYFSEPQFSERSLLPALPERESSHAAILKQQGINKKLPESMKYSPFIKMHSFQQEFAALERDLVLAGDEVVTECFVIEGDGILKKSGDKLFIYRHAGKSLVLDINSKELALK